MRMRGRGLGKAIGGAMKPAGKAIGPMPGIGKRGGGMAGAKSLAGTTAAPAPAKESFRATAAPTVGKRALAATAFKSRLATKGSPSFTGAELAKGYRKVSD